MRETKAPAGFQLLREDLQLVLSDSGEVNFDGQVSQLIFEGGRNQTELFTVSNRRDFALPHTGGAGIGTSWSLVAGVLLAAGGVLFSGRVKKRS